MTSPTLRMWNGIALAAMLVMAGIAVADRVIPRQTAASMSAARIKSDDQIREQTYAERKKLLASQELIASRVWADTTDGIGAKSLDLCTKLAKMQGLKLTAYRPQKPVEDGELIRLSFVMTLEGPFPAVQQFVRQLESPARKLSVHLVQVASADDASDLVNATIGITAFVEKPKTNKVVIATKTHA